MNFSWNCWQLWKSCSFIWVSLVSSYSISLRALRRRAYRFFSPSSNFCATSFSLPCIFCTADWYFDSTSTVSSSFCFCCSAIFFVYSAKSLACSASEFEYSFNCAFKLEFSSFNSLISWLASLLIWPCIGGFNFFCGLKLSWSWGELPVWSKFVAVS